MGNMPTDKKPAGKRKGQDDDDHRTALPDAKKVKVPLSSNDSESVACHQCRSKKQRPCMYCHTFRITLTIYFVQLFCNVQVT